MRLTIAILIASLLQVSGSALAQKISLKVSNSPMSSVLQELRQQSGYIFFYRDNIIDKAHPVSINVQQAEFKEVLEKIFIDQPLTYVINERTITIKSRNLHQPLSAAASSLIHLKGQVTDSLGVPLAGASILVIKSGVENKTNSGELGGNSGSAKYTTDENGFFELDAEEGDMVVVRFVGYERHAFVMTKNMPEINKIVLKVSLEKLTEVVIQTGFQNFSKERATGAVSKPDMKVFSRRVGTQDVLTRLEGQVAGLQLEFDGEGQSIAGSVFTGPTNTRKMTIRGKGSVYTETQPLYVVNGVPVASFHAINIEDIQDITVLKDAAAGAIWGSRAANGVIVITTKSGRINQELTVNYSANSNYQGRPFFGYLNEMITEQYLKTARETFDPVNFPWQTLSNRRHVIAPHEQILYDQYRGRISGTTAAGRLDSLGAINATEETFRALSQPAFTNNHTLSVSGGTKSYTFFGSLGYIGAEGSTIGNKSNQYLLNLNQSFNIKERVSINLISNIANNVLKDKNVQLQRLLPYQLIKDKNGNAIPMNYANGLNDSTTNLYQSKSRINLGYTPLNEFGLINSKGNSTYVNLTSDLNVKILKGLKFQGNYSLQRTYGKSELFTDNRSFVGRSQIVDWTVAPSLNTDPIYYLPTTGGTLTAQNINLSAFTIRNRIAYETNLRKGLDMFSLQLGQEATSNTSMFDGNTLYGFDRETQTYPQQPDFVKLRNGISGTVTGARNGLRGDPVSKSIHENRIASIFALANYTLNSKYMLDMSWRQDRSSMFGTEISRQNKPFWSVGAKWLLGQETFMSDIKWLSQLGIRGSYGVQGLSPYTNQASAYDVLRSPSGTDPYAINGRYFDLASPGNMTISWETVTTVNLGLDFAVLDNRLSGSIEAYDRTSTDLLRSITTTPLTGFSDYWGNLGKLKNRGLEMTLRSENIKTRSFVWESNLTASYNRNKLLEFVEIPPGIEMGDFYIGSGAIKIGSPLNSVFAYRYAGLDQMGDPQIYLADNSITKTPLITKVEDIVYMGTADSPFTLGLSNVFNYKLLSLTLNLTGKFGGMMRRDVSSEYFTERFTSQLHGIGGNVPAYFADRWKKPGDEAFTNIPSWEPSIEEHFTRRSVQYWTQGDINMVSSDYLKLRDVSLAIELPQTLIRSLKIQKFDIFLQASNFMLWKANKFDMDPEYQTVGQNRALPPFRHAYAIGVNITL
ncbi:SusC/RagA family TonB-linked outer membrane protein [Pedobacter psychroterrae]|nr:SusC/RagA family TonB-linked outer membrane protein [Pedobacter psychroterrae]